MKFDIKHYTIQGRQYKMMLGFGALTTAVSAREAYADRQVDICKISK